MHTQALEPTVLSPTEQSRETRGHISCQSFGAKQKSYSYDTQYIEYTTKMRGSADTEALTCKARRRTNEGTHLLVARVEVGAVVSGNDEVFLPVLGRHERLVEPLREASVHHHRRIAACVQANTYTRTYPNENKSQKSRNEVESSCTLHRLQNYRTKSEKTSRAGRVA